MTRLSACHHLVKASHIVEFYLLALNPDGENEAFRVKTCHRSTLKNSQHDNLLEPPPNNCSTWHCMRPRQSGALRSHNLAVLSKLPLSIVSSTGLTDRLTTWVVRKLGGSSKRLEPPSVHARWNTSGTCCRAGTCNGWHDPCPPCSRRRQSCWRRAWSEPGRSRTSEISQPMTLLIKPWGFLDNITCFSVPFSQS